MTTIDIFKQAESEVFSMDERAASFFSKTKHNVMIGVTVYALILLILIYFHNGYEIEILVGYIEVYRRNSCNVCGSHRCS